MGDILTDVQEHVLATVEVILKTHGPATDTIYTLHKVTGVYTSLQRAIYSAHDKIDSEEKRFTDSQLL